MFNRTIVHHTRTNTEYVPYDKTITINKSSTAEDARLLKEIEDEALNKLSNRVAEQIGDNSFELVRYDIEHRPYEMSDRMRVVFKINGKVHSIEVSKDSYQKDVIGYVAKEMTTQIFKAFVGKDAYDFFTEMK